MMYLLPDEEIVGSKHVAVYILNINNSDDLCAFGWLFTNIQSVSAPFATQNKAALCLQAAGCKQLHSVPLWGFQG
jgi:hypothetical protein